ncbi:EamA family transporter [Rhizomonospora bruguierae]|uniref:EamA family transporter n=1 Tax=Rhizomonospora bruguierae TaxID=1581705 RepID=UPI001BD1A9DB|nr:EamA family transporter [Micromonospora sp. NBRC 107566]
MLPIVLAGLAALVWGSADFSGGKASQRANPLAVTVLSQVYGLPVLLVCLLLVPGSLRLNDLAWGAGAGASGLVGIVLLYRALSGGAMAVAAPTTAVTAAVVAIGVGLLTDDAPGVPALLGIAAAVAAIALVSMGGGGGGRVARETVVYAVGSGVFFGAFFALLGQATTGGGMWPLVTARVASIGVGALWMLATRTPPKIGLRGTLWSLPAGGLDIAANALYLAAAGRGQLSVVAAIASLYPASTVLLALIVDRERLRAIQLAGLGFAATALVLASS